MNWDTLFTFVVGGIVGGLLAIIFLIVFVLHSCKKGG